jgi:prepilin-type N-terminal cleavage/methylation domain-containing protein
MIRTRRQEGFTLVEIMIATLLIAIMTTGLCSVALNSRKGVGPAKRKIAAAEAGRRLLEQLKGYVTADKDSGDLPGPGAGSKGWTLPGESCGDCFALSAGTHELDPGIWLPSDLASYNGKISYAVTSLSTPNGNQPTVKLTITWDEP